MRVNGKKIADTILEELKKKVAESEIEPTLAIIQVGNLQESSAYIREKKRAGKKIGVKVIHDYLPDATGEAEISQKISKYNTAASIQSIIVQLPLPSHINSDNVISKISPTKDVDGFLPSSPHQPPVACAVLKVLQIGPIFLKKLRSKQIVIIGRGRTGGKPLMQTFNKMEIPYTLIHSQTKNPVQTMRTADIIISCVGKPHIVTSAKIKSGVILISVGVYRAEDGKLHGDYEEAEIKDKAAFYTPTPGGIGPLTVACLLQNVAHTAGIK